MQETFLEQRSPTRELAWAAIVDSLNESHSSKFQLKDKNEATRERWNLLRKVFCKKMSEEENASGIPLIDFLRKKAAADCEIRQQELRAKQQEQSTANDESYDSSASTNEYCIFKCCGKATN